MDVAWLFGVAATLIVVETVLIVWLLRHRAAAARARRLLNDRLRFETLLADLSAKLIHVETRNLDAALGAALQQAIAFLGMDRGTLDEYVDGTFVPALSWAEPGIQPRSAIVVARHFSWTMEMLQRGEIIRFSISIEIGRAHV